MPRAVWKLHSYSLLILPAILLLLSPLPAFSKAFSLTELKQEIAKYKKEIRLKPGNAMAHYHLGTAYDKAGMFLKASQEFAMARANDPGNKELGAAIERALLKQFEVKKYSSEGWSNILEKKYEEAIEKFTKALKINPNAAMNHTGLGNAYAGTGKDHEAIKEYKDALKLKPDLAEAHCLLGRSYEKIEKNEEAIRELKEALKIKPDYAEAHFFLGLSYAKVGKLKEGIRSYKELLRLVPDDADAHFSIGLFFMILEDYEQAIMSLKKAEKLFRKNNNRLFATRAEQTLQEAYEKSGSKSEDYPIVEIQTPPKTTAKPKAAKRKKTPYLGTGFMLRQSGYVLTNYHVVEGAKSIMVKFQNGERSLAKIVVKDHYNDIAALKPNRPPEMPTFNIPLGDSSRARAGGKVFTIGFPASEILGQKAKYSEGVINSTTGINDDPRLFQISVPVQPGNSGSPLFNEDGEVVGITTLSLDVAKALKTMGSVPQNVNFAIKSIFIENLLLNLPGTARPTKKPATLTKGPEGSNSSFVGKVMNNIVLIEVER